MPIYTNLKGFNDISEPSISEVIEGNVISFFDWGFINKGAFFNVTIPTSGQYGGSRHRLRLVTDPGYTQGQVWETFRSNLVWESGLETAVQPIAISGIYVNGAFFPSNTTGAYKHYVNYPLGRVIFDTAIATNKIVTMEYSYKWISIVDANSIPWFKEMQYNSFRNDLPDFNITGSGDWNQLGITRLQLPAVVCETVPNGTSKPYALGGGQWVYRDLVMHVFAERDTTAYKIADIITNQKEKTIILYDINRMGQDNRFPLTSAGTLASGALTYPQLVEAYQLNNLRFSNTHLNNGTWFNASLYHTTSRLTTEVVLGNI